jgi:class 3 adenylate cyclase/tetratricopeptide (TPR) repeat protein
LTASIRSWLESLGLALYAETFEENDLDVELAADLTDADLKDLGVASMGHRKKLLRAIEALAAAPAAIESAPSTIESSFEPSEAATGQAERRQLTVVFCDLVGSTELSHRLDPEDMRDLMRRYQDAVSGAVNRYEGHVAKFLGDGVLAYFGWPQAHEDQAERAVHAGLEAITRTAGLSAEGAALAARVGIASGLVVVGDLSGESDAISGETPNLAARLQAIAAPGQAVIGPVTERLVSGAFKLQDLGFHGLKGFAEPVQAWSVTAARSRASRFESSHKSRLTPLVGRAHELALMCERWRRACDGEGQVVLLSGEAGIGKSRLLAALWEAVQAEPHVRIRFQCSPYHSDSAFYPIARQLERAAGFSVADGPSAKLGRLSSLLGGGDLDCAAVATLMALPTEERFGPLDLTPQQLKLRAIDALLRHLREVAANKPVLLTFEDLHWIDPSSQDLLTHIATELTHSRLLAVMTHRPEYQAPFRALGTVTALTLTYLSRAEIEHMVRSVAGGQLEPTLLDQIVDRTDGIPLFVEEMTKSVTEAEVGRGEVPETLQASLLSRLDRLGKAKEVAQIGAVIGRDFDYGLLERVSERCHDDLLAAIDHLVKALLVFQSGIPPDARYTFKHALVQDAAYDSLLKSRREVLHGRIATALERDFPSVGENEPEILARHHSAAGNTESAIEYWRRAGERASGLASGLEARNHFERAIALLSSLPEDRQRDAIELPLRLGHAWALQLTRGPADEEMGAAYSRALELSEVLDQPRPRFAALFGMWRHNMWRHGPSAAVIHSESLRAVGEQSESVADRVLVNYVTGSTRMLNGDEKAGAHHAQVAWDLFKASSESSLAYRLGHNQGVSSLTILALSQWALGKPSQARRTIDESLSEAEAMDEPLTLTVVRAMACSVFELLGVERPDKVETARAYANDYGFSVWAGFAGTSLGWLRFRSGAEEEGLDWMQKGIETWRAGGVKLLVTGRLALYGRMCLEMGRLDQAREILLDAKNQAKMTGENFWLTEILRYLGRLSQAENDNGQAEQYFRQALAVAETRGANGFALRAAIDLARHLGDEGKAILSRITARFAAADDSPDLRDARALLSGCDRAQSVG